MRISDWSSDVCSSDLGGGGTLVPCRLCGLDDPRLVGVGGIEPGGLRLDILDHGIVGTQQILDVRNDIGIDPLRRLDTLGGALGRLCRQLIEHRRSEEHTSELQSLMRISYAVFCLKKKK